ncbi:MAG TPA: type I secretion system permease/ATPase [Burkholderiales bacterium]|nr:type I secretion system permease/ATPase [Burkholderiales bacterium]
MHTLVAGLRPVLPAAVLFSFAVNLLLLVPPLYLLQVFDRVLTGRSGETLVALTAAAALALVVMALLEAARSRLFALASAKLERTLGPRVLAALLERGGGARSAPGLRDVQCLRAFLAGPGAAALFDAPWLPLFLGLIFLFHPLLGAIALAGSIAMWLLAALNERLTRAPLERAQAEAQATARFIDAGLRNAPAAAALGMLPALARGWARRNDRALVEHLQVGALLARYAAWTKFARQAVQVAMLAAGAWLVVRQQVTPGVMIAATILLGRALAPVEALVAGWRALVEALAAARRLDALLGSEPAGDPGVALPAPSGRLQAERVVYAPPGVARPVLRGVSFALAPGESLGVIGPSAGGKSTLARLLVGLARPVHGAVRLDAAEVAAWPRDALGRHLGYLPQEVELFEGTVAQNIARLGEVDADQVIKAAQAASVHELVLRLPQGYDTPAGDGSLSAGQRQRIALARALYGDPRLVVLDEPNAYLDHDGDQALLHALRRLKEAGATVVIVAHRPSILAGVDKLLVLREGMVEAFGPREEIMPRVTRPPAVRGVA